MNSADLTMVSVDQLAEMWGVSRAHIFVMMRDEGLPSVKLGRTRRIRLDAAGDWLAKRSS